MGKAYQTLQTCAICKTTNKMWIFGSYYDGGSSGLDTKPLASTKPLSFNIQTCSKCFYCAVNISHAPDGTKEIVESQDYQILFRNSKFPYVAREFLCASMIMEKKQKYSIAGRYALNAAWACEDNKDFKFEEEEDKDFLVKISIECRKIAINLFLKAKTLFQRFVKDEHEEDLLLLDLYRRSGELKNAKELCQKKLFKLLQEELQNETIYKLFKYEEQLLAQNDTASHTVAEALDFFDPTKEIIKAIEEENIELVKKLYSQDGIQLDLNEECSFQCPLQYAVKLGQLETVEFILKNEKIDLNNGKYASTLLRNATSSGCLNTVKLLLRYGADLEHAYCRNENFLNLAVRSGNESLVRFLYEKGVRDPEGIDIYDSSLYRACDKEADKIDIDDHDLKKINASNLHDIASSLLKDFKISNFLFDQMENINSRDSHGDTLLMEAMNLCRYVQILYLLDKGADVRQVDHLHNTTLIKFLLNSFGKPEDVVCMIAKIFIQKGVDIHAINNDGESALTVAFWSRQFQTAKILIKKGADLHTSNARGSILSAACNAMNYDQVKKLLEMKLDINITDKAGNTPAMTLCKNYNEDKQVYKILNLLIEHGADISTQNHQGESILDFAIDYKLTETTKLLLSTKPEMLKITPNNDLLFKACSWHNCSNPSLPEYLISKGANINASDDDGDTPLSKLCSVRTTEAGFFNYFDDRKKMITLLCNLGADPKMRNRFGESALSDAVASYDYEIIDIFKESNVISEKDLKREELKRDEQLTR